MINRTVKILLADDHQVVRNGLVLMLDQQKSFIPHIIEARDGNEVIEKAEKELFDIIIMDVSLPNRDGISATKYLTKKNPDIKILALSMHNEVYIIKQMLAAGAMGYLLKNTGIEELTNAILTVLDSKKYFSNEVSQSLMGNNFVKTAKKKLNDFDPNKLTTRETEVLFLIANELTSLEISKKLVLSVRTIEGYRENILKKLNIKTSAGLIKYAIYNGIIK